MAKKKSTSKISEPEVTSDSSHAEREKALTSTLTELTKRFGEGTVVKLGDARHLEVDSISTGSLAIDIALGVGGIPRGRITEIYGPESSGKTTLCLSVVAQAQKMGGICAFIDMEHALDPNYCVLLGVDVDNLYISQPDTGEQAMEIAEELIRSGAIDVIVLDSVAALVPRAEIEGEMGDSHVGLQARLMSQALRKISGAIKQTNTAFLLTNQLREKIGVMYGCFQYSTRVVLADGTKEKIGKIVNQKMDVEVLSYNERIGSFEPRRIVNWFDNGNADHFLQFVVDNNKPRGRSEFACTPNHMLLTEYGYMPAGDLEIGDKLISVVKQYLSPAHEQVVYGSVLGDGQIRYTSDNNAQLRIGHGERQTEYARWKQSLFEGLTHYEGIHVKGGLYFDTASMYELAQIHSISYANGKKHPSQAMIDRLDPLAIAIWYMDDGTFDKSRLNRASISCAGLEEEPKRALVEWFQQRGIDAKLALRGRINFGIEATRRLHEMIAPYVHPSMDYKLMPEFRGQFRPLRLEPCERDVPVAMPILDIYIKPETRSMKRFDIEVEGNHCYVVDNVVVHNSNETTSGGRALRFYASVRIDIRRIQAIKQGEEIIGNRTRVKVTKNKVAPPFRQAEFDLLYGEGFSSEGDVLDIGTELGIIEKRGAFYRYNDGLIGQGRENAKQYLRDNPELMFELETLIRQQHVAALGATTGSGADDDDAAGAFLED